MESSLLMQTMFRCHGDRLPIGANQRRG